MTPNELLDKYGFGHRSDAILSRPFRQYADENCVVAYSMGDFTLSFLIKSSRMFITFLALKKGLHFGGYDYKLIRLDSSSIKSYMDKYYKNFYELKDIQVVDEKAFQDYKEKAVVQAI